MYISCCYIGQTSGKVSGCQKQPLLKRYAYKLNVLVNRSILWIVYVPHDTITIIDSILNMTNVSNSISKSSHIPSFQSTEYRENS